MTFFSIKYLVLKWNYFFLSAIIVFIEFFNLHMKQLGFNPRSDPAEGCHRGLKGYVTIYAVFKLSVLFDFGFVSEIKEKRGARDLGQFVVFVLAPCCWDDNFELELVSFVTISCQILVGNDKELEDPDLPA